MLPTVHLRLPTAMLAGFWLMDGSAQAACPASATTIRSTSSLAIQAYEDWQQDEFERQRAILSEELDCLEEILPAADVAQVHLLTALAYGNASDEHGTITAFRALLVAEPNYSPSESLIAPGSLLDKALGDARAGHWASMSRTLPPGTWFLDGRPGASSIPTDRAALLQEVTPSGSLSTWYLDGAQIPVTLLNRLPLTSASPVASVQPPPSRQRHPSRMLAIASGLTGAAAAVTLGSAAKVERSFHDTTDLQEAESLASKNHLLAATGIGLSATTGGLLVSAMIAGQW